MPGFRITNFDCKSELYKYKFANTVNDSIKHDKWALDRSTLNLFMDDKVMYEDDTRIVIIEGVILNSTELCAKYCSESWHETVRKMVPNEEWFSELEGPVSGAIYDKNKDEWVVFTGKLGEKAIFYYCENGLVVVGSQLKYLTDALHEKKTPLLANEDALLRLMAYGSYIGDETCIDSIKRVYPGHYITIHNGQITEHRYHIFDLKQNHSEKTDEEYIDMLDSSFRMAMQRILDKSKEYGYKTLLDISGGYDSRLNCYVAKALGASDVIMDCYAQSNSHDFKVSNAIATELNYDYVFRSLDNASCMFGIDDNVVMLNGATFYAGITGGRDMLRMLSGFGVGLEITGLLGDVHDGSMVTNRCDGSIDKEWYRDSCTLEEGVDYNFIDEEEKRFNNHTNEHFWFYNRGMICGMSSFFIRQNFVEAVTPFGGSEFVETYLSIPWDKRVEGKLLRKWMATRYPEAGKYTNARNGLKLSDDYNDSKILVGKFVKQVKKIYSRVYKGKRPIGMNDVTYWYATNNDFHDYLNNYIGDNITLANKSAKVNLAINKLMESGSVIDKIYIATVLAIYRNFIV